MEPAAPSAVCSMDSPALPWTPMRVDGHRLQLDDDPQGRRIDGRGGDPLPVDSAQLTAGRRCRG